MKKTGLVFILIGAVALLYACFLFADDRQSRIDALPAAYQELGRGCLQKGSFNCCMSSVQSMAGKNAILAGSKGECPPDYQGGMLKCIDTYKWCEPLSRQKDEQNEN